MSFLDKNFFIGAIGALKVLLSHDAISESKIEEVEAFKSSLEIFVKLINKEEDKDEG